MNLLNSIIALSLLALMSFSLFKTIELSGCRHEIVSKGFWLATELIVPSEETKKSDSCGSRLSVKKEGSKILASHASGDYEFQLSTDINSKKLEESEETEDSQ